MPTIILPVTSGNQPAVDKALITLTNEFPGSKFDGQHFVDIVGNKSNVEIANIRKDKTRPFMYWVTFVLTYI